MQVAGYVRVSSRSQARTQTIDQQIDRLHAHAAAQSWTLAQDQIFRDAGYSGASLRRPGLDRLRDAALTSAEVVGIRGARRRAGATATSLAQARRRLAARVVIGPLG